MTTHGGLNGSQSRPALPWAISQHLVLPPKLAKSTVETQQLSRYPLTVLFALPPREW